MTKKWLRWMPAAAVPAVIAAAALAGSLPASAGDPLPAKSAQEVLALMAQHSAPSLSGTLEQTSRLGLPQLPKTGPSGGSDAASVLELLTGPHTARIFLDGPSNMRVQVLDRLAERNAVRSGDQLWLYSSKDNTATHVTLPADTARHHSYQHPEAGTDGVMPTPADLAAKLLAAADPTTEVTVLPEVNVAGRPAYNLVVTPRTEGTLIASAAIAVDGQSGLPLSVELKARGQSEPAFKLAFSNVSFQAPDASVFAFSPPPGATVKEVEVPQPSEKAVPGAVSGARDSDTGHPRPTVTGTGWESVVEFPAGPASAESGANMTSDPLLQQAAVAVPGGRLFSTAVVNVLLTDDGRVFAGSVPAERLLTAAAAR